MKNHEGSSRRLFKIIAIILTVFILTQWFFSAVTTWAVDLSIMQYMLEFYASTSLALYFCTLAFFISGKEPMRRRFIANIVLLAIAVVLTGIPIFRYVFMG